MNRFLLIFLLLLLTIGHSAQGAEPVRLTIAAAADLKYAMDEVVKAFKDQHPEAMVDLVTGSSGKFYEQIAHEAPFDIFFSADVKFPEKLKEQGLTASEVRMYARGRIVLWSANMNAGKMTLQDLADPRIKQIAIANPKHAPYGQRAQEALENAGLWTKVQNKLVFGENIAQTAQFAETGAADVGLIALSLAVSPSLTAKGGYYLIPETLHEPLDQAYVLLKRAEKNALAGAFADFVASEPARAIFRSYGFILPGEALPGAAEPESRRSSQ
ncbi:molybdate ABC transporter substrate-binding protein [Methylocaldum sp.]|uniref:molybdate ABC transporter substrate-binding protein n=1 Tax=Methylocaldum sp. TaxID=1969727 RepID=UPI002D3E59E0|nr:molybdate ABC transporter substrate-binding protein [Methylocaldum sp.]HYE34034.1 molybdate ABC transporter substrate-binding protein [Methylocaldum sp.]